MGCFCVPAFPIRPADPSAIWISEPLPIDIGEVSKLCEIEQTRIGSHFECVRETRRKPVLNWSSTDPVPSAAGALRVPPATGLTNEFATVLYESRLTHPAWEVLSPAVVVRRRPVRVQRLDVS